jgi:hypothetical protein
MLDATHTIKILEDQRVHSKFHNIVELAHHLCPTQSVSYFMFSTQEETSALSRLDSEAATITIYLHRIFQSSCDVVLDPKVPFSLRADIWLSFVREVFKQFLKSCKRNGESTIARCEHLKPVLPKAPELGKLLSYVGIYYDIEPPLVRKDPLFGPLIEAFITAGERRGEPWATHQRQLIHELFRFPFGMHLAPVVIRNYFKWATGNLNNPNWPEYVPSFNADRAEIEQVVRDNRSWQQHLEEMAREKAQFQREMELLERFEEKIERMAIKEGKAR